MLLDKSSASITLVRKDIGYFITDIIVFLIKKRSLLSKLKVKEQALYFETLKGMDNNLFW